MKRYTQEQIEWLREYVPGHSYKAVWEAFNKRYPDTQVGSIKAMSSLIKRHGLTNGIDERFKKGQKSFNKGLKQEEYMSKEGIEKSSVTRFRKGHTPINHREIGSTRISKDGYIEIKIAEPNKWTLRHLKVWRDAGRDIPEKHCVIHINGIKTDDRLENLMLVERAELVRLNQSGLAVVGQTEINEVAIALAKLQNKIGKRKRG